MYAVIRTGNKQYRVEPGVELLVEKLGDDLKPGQSVEMTDVLMFADGENITVGTPQLPAVVHCTFLGDEKGEKLRSVKYRRRKNFRRTYGHRQTYARLKVERLERKGN